MFLPLLFNLRFNCKEPLVENLSFVWRFVASFRLIGVDSLLSVSEPHSFGHVFHWHGLLFDMFITEEI
ncbi:hypothetical protein AAH056_27075, partial [Bacteroides thetaiotaomicron]|uniref:hypothetical protein n=1 Tax=Bacteroides thetaiotaomicron TaxID=818 RepID=UPI0039B50E7E